MFIVAILIAMAIAFGVCLKFATNPGGTHINTSPRCERLTIWGVSTGILEWAIAFGFTFYLLTFWYDLRQAKGVPKGATKRPQQMHQMGMIV